MLTVSFRQKTRPVFFSGNDPKAQHKRPLQYAAAGNSTNSPDTKGFSSIVRIHFASSEQKTKRTSSSQADGNKANSSPAPNKQLQRAAKEEEASNPFNLSGQSTPKYQPDGGFTPPYQEEQRGTMNLVEYLADKKAKDKHFAKWLKSDQE